MISRRSLLLAAPAIIIPVAARSLCCGNSPSMEAQQFFDRTLTPPDDSWAAKYCNYVDSLVPSGAWAKIKGLWVYATFQEQTFTLGSAISLTNLKSPAYGAFTYNNLPVFTPYRGWTGGGVTSNIQTGFVPSSDWSQNDACMFAWCLTIAQLDQTMMLASVVSPYTELWPKYSDGKTYYGLNSATEDNVTLGLDSSGFWLINRTGASSMTLDRNGSVVHASTASSAAPTSTPMVCPLGNYQVSIFGLASSFSTPQKTALYAGSLAFMQGLGLA